MVMHVKTSFSFDIGQLKAEDRQQIPLAQAKPMLLPPALQNPDELFDNLELNVLLRKNLLKASYASVRGVSAQLPAVYVDADQMTGAIRPSGNYQIEGTRVIATLVLVKDGTKLTNFQVQGDTKDLEGFTLKIIERINQAIREIE